jgi:hypothetical protein
MVAKVSHPVPPPFTGGVLLGGGSVSSTFAAGGDLSAGGLLTGSIQVVLP